MLRKILVAAATVLSFAGSAFGQAQPSEAPLASRSSIDENGVDLITGKFYTAWPTIAIGLDTPAPLIYTRRGRTDSQDSLLSGINCASGTCTVTVLGSSTRWTGSGPSYTPAEGQGGSLTYNSSTLKYTHTSSTGVVTIFDATAHMTTPNAQNSGLAESVTFPTGERFDYAYDFDIWCITKFSGECSIAEIEMYRLLTVTSTLGHRIEFTYDATATCCGAAWQRPASVAAKSLHTSGAWQTLSYTNTTVTDANGRIFTFAKNADGDITSIKFHGSAANDVTIAYNATTKRVLSVAKFGLTWTYAFSDSGNTRTTTVTAPGSRVRTLTSDIAKNRVLTDRNALNQTSTFTYDASGRLIKAQAPEGNSTNYTYDAIGNVTKVEILNKSNAGPIKTFEAAYPSGCTNWKLCGKPVWTKDGNGNQTSYVYDATHGGVTEINYPWTGLPPGLPAGDWAPLRKTFIYTSLSTFTSGAPAWRLTSVKQCATAQTCAGSADEAVTVIAYGANDLLPSSVTQRSGNSAVSVTRTIAYDHQRLVRDTDGPLPGAVDATRVIRDAMGEAIGGIGIDPDGAGGRKFAATKNEYDPTTKRLTRVRVGTVNSFTDLSAFSQLAETAYAYDGYGRLIKTEQKNATGAAYAVAQTSFDSWGRPACVAQRLNAITAPPADACDPAFGAPGSDRVSKTIFDALDRPLQSLARFRASAGATPAEELIAETTYTTNGRTATLKDGEGRTTTYEYDSYDRLQRTTYPASSQPQPDKEEWVYDDAGNILQERRRNGAIIYSSYDAMNRRTQRNGSGVPTTTYKYDLFGRLRIADQSAAPTMNNQFTYNALGWLLTESTTADGATRTTTYGYDAHGRMTSLAGQESGVLTLAYKYNDAGEMTLVKKSTDADSAAYATFGYDDLGRRNSVQRQNGVNTAYTYAPANLANDWMSHTFSGAPASNVSISMAYNAAGQLSTRAIDKDVYAYAGHYNVDLTSMHNALNQTSSVSRASPAQTTTFQYDALGNLTCDKFASGACQTGSGGMALAYDNDNQLTSVTTSAGTKTLRYDAVGRLYEVKTSPSVLTRFAYAGSAIIAEYDAAGVALRRHIPGPGVDETIATLEGSGTTDIRRLITDERGSIIGITNAAGTSVSPLTYDAYGKPGASNTGRFQYTGQAWIGELGLYYYKARFYSPNIGRFLQTDPIGYADGMNLYAYVGGDPVNATDPSGMVEDIVTVTASRSDCWSCNIWGSFGDFFFRDVFPSRDRFLDDLDVFGGGGGGGGGIGDTSNTKTAIDNSICGSGTAFGNLNSVASSLLPGGSQTQIESLTNALIGAGQRAEAALERAYYFQNDYASRNYDFGQPVYKRRFGNGYFYNGQWASINWPDPIAKGFGFGPNEPFDPVLTAVVVAPNTYSGRKKGGSVSAYASRITARSKTYQSTANIRGAPVVVATPYGICLYN